MFDVYTVCLILNVKHIELLCNEMCSLYNAALPIAIVKIFCSVFFSVSDIV